MPERRPHGRPGRAIKALSEDSTGLDELLARTFFKELFEVREANLLLHLAEARVDKNSRKPGLRGFG